MLDVAEKTEKEEKLPKFGTAKPAATGGPIPRELQGFERAVDGAKRYRIVCRNYGTRPTKYILARSEKDATDCYLKLTGVAKDMAKAKDKAEEPELIVSVMSD